MVVINLERFRWNKNRNQNPPVIKRHHHQDYHHWIMAPLYGIIFPTAHLKPTLDWTEADREYHLLEHNALFWTITDMCTDLWYLVFILSGIWKPMIVFDASSENTAATPIIFLLCGHLILSSIGDVMVILLKRYNQNFLLVSMFKGFMFMMGFGVCLMLLFYPLYSHKWGSLWPLMAFVIMLYISAKGNSFVAHVWFHVFVAQIGVKQHLIRTRGVNVGGEGQCQDQGQNQGHPDNRSAGRLTDVENPLETFYVLKTAQLRHNLLMKETLLPKSTANNTVSKKEEGMNNWTENYYDEKPELKLKNTNSETDGNGQKKKTQGKDNIWTLSGRGKDKFMTREIIAMDGEKYTIYDGQIAL